MPPTGGLYVFVVFWSVKSGMVVNSIATRYTKSLHKLADRMFGPLGLRIQLNYRDRQLRQNISELKCFSHRLTQLAVRACTRKSKTCQPGRRTPSRDIWTSFLSSCPLLHFSRTIVCSAISGTRPAILMSITPQTEPMCKQVI